MGKYGEANLKAGIEAVFYKEQREGFLYSSHNVTGYIRAVAKSEYSKAIQTTNEQQAQRQKEQVRQVQGGQLYNEIKELIKCNL
jgi:hypothetical protein